MANNKPGVMIYFETGRAIKGLDYEAKGRLFDAIMEYGEYGTTPALDGVLAAVWPFIANGIDRDASRYADVITRRQRAAYAKWWREYAKKNGMDADDEEARDRWIDMQMHAKDANASDAMQTHANDANASDAMQMMPTTTTTTTTAPTTTSTTTPTATTAGEREGTPPRAMGRYGNVLLTDEEYDGLMRDIPQAQELIEKLSMHIKSSGRRYESHEATIRKWAMEDEAKRSAQSGVQKQRTSGGNPFLGIVEGGLV